MASPSPSPSPSPPPLPPPPQSRSASPSLSPKQELLSLPPPPETGATLPPPKKSPPLPWTHQETLALIQAYQEKWYSLKKGQLKAFQWEEVSVTVAARCGFDEPSKTATQCRHKIEKLRKRYRSELQKRHPNSWQYFELMDQMERGPMPLNARPIAAVKSSSANVAHSNSNNSNGMNHGYNSLYSNSADYYYNHGVGGGGSDESDEKWNSSHGHGVETRAGNKSKGVNNVLLGNVKKGVRSARTAAVGRGFNGSGNRSARVLRNPINHKRKVYYNGNDSSDDDDDDDSMDDVEEDQRVRVEDEGEEGITGIELAGEIRGFAERFMRMENKKIEMMREAEMHRMEMEKRRIEMILDAQRKIIDTIDRAFGASKKAKMAQES